MILNDRNRLNVPEIKENENSHSFKAPQNPFYSPTKYVSPPSTLSQTLNNPKINEINESIKELKDLIINKSTKSLLPKNINSQKSLLNQLVNTGTAGINAIAVDTENAHQLTIRLSKLRIKAKVGNGQKIVQQIMNGKITNIKQISNREMVNELEGL